MSKQSIKKMVDTSNDKAIIEADISLYQSNIRNQAAAFLAKIDAESRRQRRSKIKLIAILDT